MNEYEIYSNVKTSISTRPYLDIHTKFYNLRTGNNGIITEPLTQKDIKEIIDICNKTGMPAQVSIEFDNSLDIPSRIVQFVVLPTLLDANVTDIYSADRIAYFATPEIVRKETEKTARLHKREYYELHKKHEEIIKEYVREDILELYFFTLARLGYDDKTVEHLRSLPIIKERYNLENILPDNIIPCNLNIEQGKTFEESLYNFTKKYALENSQNKNIAMVFGFNSYLIGLEKPQNQAMRDSYAQKMVDLARFRKRQMFEIQFMENYKTRKPKNYVSNKPLLTLPRSTPSSMQPY